jgi:sarcosine oxidase subunit gamma
VTIPASLTRRSFVYRELAAAGAVFAPVRGMAAPLRFGDGDDLERAKRLGLCDLSALARSGYKGWAAVAWARAQAGVRVPHANNTAARQDDGSLIARLADTEILVAGPLEGSDTAGEALAAAWAAARPEGAYPVPRAEACACFLISGAHAADMLAKLCGVDLRPKAFAAGAVAQTMMAGTSAIVIRDDLGQTLGFLCFCEVASALYLWRSLLDAMAEFDGGAIGLEAARRLRDAGQGAPSGT